MAYYEQVLIARQDLTASKVAELIEKFTSILEKNGGKVLKKEDWGLRTLAYKIQKNRKGYYTMLHLEAPASAVVEMERLLRLDENILRYLTIKMDSLPEGNSVMMESSKSKRKEETVSQGEE